MALTRREFIKTSTLGAAGFCLASRLRAETGLKIKIGACDWSFQESCNPDGFDAAKALGMDGLEISSTDEAKDVLKIADPEFQAAYKTAMDRTGLAIPSIALGLMNSYPLASDDRGPAWLEQTIAAAAALNAKVILIAFFSDGDLLEKAGLFGLGGGTLKEKELDVVVERLKVAAPKAAEAGVILGLENTLSAAQNLSILERVQHDAVRVYYDVGNSTYNDYDVPAEIRDLGDRICQIHFKDGANNLGEGQVDMNAVAKAMKDIHYEGWVVLETAIREQNRDASFRKNIDFVKSMFKTA
ncbi:MAG: L-ribulose-5-phosphate 3-epimerase UlaE [Candidatus Hydrogenedentes bacterium ADurb.Bin101]|nr:MAG: L-ribulose-5-phosphate 3-epimerase UlaE [Candidatus Hydrogenedentes bacterium ADurb.Bin101]